MARTALVTGGNRGIGQQVAHVLATDGWDVLIGARDKQKGAAVPSDTIAGPEASSCTPSG